MNWIIKTIGGYTKEEYLIIKEELEAIKKSEKCIFIEPTINLAGINNLKKPLYLSGDNLVIKNNTINIDKIGKNTVLTILRGNYCSIISNIFRNTEN